jgi:signal transduction histidine kinase/ActR/RegA family two-component response regulator
VTRTVLSTATRSQQLRAEQIDSAFGHALRPYIVALVVLVGAYVEGAILWTGSPHARIVAWVLLVTLCQLGSMLLIASYHRKRPAPAELGRWGLYKVLQTTLLGLAWGSGVILLHVPGVAATLLVPAMSAVAVTMASTVTNASYPPGMYPLFLGNVAPGMVYLLCFAQGDSEHAVGFALIALLIIVVIGGLVMSRLIRETMLTRMELADAAEQERVMHAQAEVARLRTNRFFSAASHDLRQPMHALGLYMTLLRKDPPEQERRALLASVGHCVDGLEQLFSAILGVAESERAGAQVQSAPLPLRRIFERAAVQFSHIAESKGLRLRVVPTSLWVHADATALGRIVGNLVDNAISYTHSGTVLIGARRDAQSCTVVVQDSGIGIAEKDRDRIFDDFYQAANPERDRSKGFGLGLATVRRLCDALGYEISVRSVVGKGSRFSVCLPRAQVVPEPVFALGLEADAAPTADDSGLTVLLIEDDTLVRDAMRRTLEGWNIQVRDCATSAQALVILADAPRRRWHVLLDYRLAGGETGLAVADRIRARFHPAPEITMVTGDIDPIVQAAAAERGILVLGKPVKPMRLRAVLSARRSAAPGKA